MGNSNGYQLASDFKFYSGYAKYDEVTEKKETWEESVDRVFDRMHGIKFKHILDTNPKFKEYFEFARSAYKEKLVLASQRSLQFGGDSILKHNARMFNCLTSYCDRVNFFQECMYWLLCGCGVGFSVQKKHIERLPTITKRTQPVKTFIAPDTIEGWADSFGVLISSYVTSSPTFPEYQGHRVDFDLSQIRPEGAYITGGFKAPGPEGLRKSLIKVEQLLNDECNRPNFDGKIRAIVAYDIVMHMADAVLSGGVRRSATICLFSPEDTEMLTAKTGDWFIKNPQRARSNNSVLLVRSKISRGLFAEIFKSIKEFGEPAFVLSEDEDVIFNPCVEIGMYPQTITGISGWQGCNLTEICGSKCDTMNNFLRACMASAIIGTMQAAYTDFRYVGKESKEIFDREALLGCSITGWMTNPELLFKPETQQLGAELIKKVNKEVAEMIGIRQAARTTCSKPSGNASVLLATTSGIGGEHSPRYFRHMQVNKQDDIGKYFAEKNPKCVQESVWSANGTDLVFAFPIIAREGSIFKKDLLGVKQLEYVKIAQQNWVEYGTNVDLCMKPYIRHNISNTIIVDDWDEVEQYIFDNRTWIAGVSFLANTGDKDYAQAPFTSILTKEEILDLYGDAGLFASGLIVDGLHAFNNNLWLACDTVLGIGIDLSKPTAENTLQRDWIRRANQFTERYFKNDSRQMCYCLKDVFNYHKWIEITRELKTINWSEVKVKPQYTAIDTLGAISCAGGACDIV